MSKILKKIENQKFILSSNSSNFDLNRTQIHRLAIKDKLEHVARGVYITKDENENIPFEFSDLFYNTLSIKHGVIFGLSALSYYNLTDEIPRKFYIAIPSQNKPSKNENIRFYRLKNHSVGIEQIKIAENIFVNIYSKEKTIVDSFKFFSLETSIKALKRYFTNNQNPDINKIIEYAKLLKVKIEPYLESILTN